MAGDHSLPLLSHSHHSAAPKSDSHEEDCYRFDLLWIFVCFVVVCFVVELGIAVFVPHVAKRPQFDLEEVRVQYLNYSVNAPSTAIVSLGIRMVFGAKNDDHWGLEYGLSSFNITYREVPLGWATLPGFYLYIDDVKWVQTTVTVDRVNLGDAAADFVRDASLNDRVELRITGDVNVTATSRWSTKTTTTTVSTDCLIAISPRKQTLTSKLCAPWI